MTAKADKVSKLLGKVELPWALPVPLDDATLLEEGLYAVLLRHVDAKKARAATERLRARYDDWNELRVSQAQEIAGVMRIGLKGVGAARDVRTYLQEVFQQVHGIDLEFLRNDAQASARFVTQLPFLGLGAGHYLLWLAGDRELPITAGMVRVLDRLGVISRTSSARKAREAIAPLVPRRKNGTAGDLDFVIRVGEVAHNWCDARKPICHDCPLVDDCVHGKKVFRDWKVQQERLEGQRQREQARQEALRKREEERRIRDEERARKKAAVADKKRRRELERRVRNEAKRRDAERARKAREKAKLEAQKKRTAEKKRREKEQARKRAAAAKKNAAVAKKKPAKKKQPAKRKPARRKPAGATKNKAVKKPVGKAAKKPATRTKKATGRKTAARKPARKK